MLAGSLIWLQQYLMLQSALWLLPFGALAISLLASSQSRAVLVGSLQILAMASAALQLSHQTLDQSQTLVTEFKVISEPQRWGRADRQFIELPDGVVGYLNPAHSVSNGSSYRAALGMRALPAAERGAFAATLRSEPELLELAGATTSFLSNLRESFLSALSGLSPDSIALVAGLAIGERGLLSEDAEHNMKQLSLTHLVAVSGANLAIVMGAIYLLARALLLPRTLRFILAGLAAAGYVAIVGPEPSVLRAAVMAYAVLLAAFLGRATAATHALGWSMVFLVSVDPWLAADFAFALSVLATAGLVILGPPLFERLKSLMPVWLALAISVTAAAQIYTLPVLLLLQPGLPTYSILANLLVEPVVAPVTILGISAAVVSPWLPWLTAALSWTASVGTFWIEQVSREMVEWPGVRTAWPAGVLGVILTVVFAWGITEWLRVRARWALMASLTALAVAAGWVLPSQWQLANWPTRDWHIAACDVGQGDAFAVRSGGATALVDVGPDPRKLNDCLLRLEIERIDLLVLSHFDFDHAGAIEGLRVPVTTAVISGFTDDRALKQTALNQLDALNAEVVVGTPGLAGRLGEMTWQVLSSGSAESLVDPNDASVVALFESSEFAFLTLGDLSEAGQLALLRGAMAEIGRLAGDQLVLKVSHHGSKDQSRRLHEVLRPSVSLISVGPNRFGHPDSQLIEHLNSLGSAVYRTDLAGSVALSMRGSDFVVTGSGRVER